MCTQSELLIESVLFSRAAVQSGRYPPEYSRSTGPNGYIIE
jgi:hypothetical protein